MLSEKKLKYSKNTFFQSNHFVFLLLLLSLLVVLLSGVQMQGLINIPFIYYALAFILLIIFSIVSIFHQNLATFDAAIELSSSAEPEYSLTYLPNHSLFHHHLESMLLIAKSRKSVLAVIYLDIDKLSELNQHYGYKRCDILISEITSRLEDLTSERDMVARLGGSRFGLIMNFPGDDVNDGVQHIVQGMRRPFVINAENIILKVSYGICVYPKDEGRVDNIIHNVTLALESIKKAGGNGYHYYKKSMSANSSNYRAEEYDLRNALERDEFCLYFQPKVDAATANIKGMEALIRWIHPKRGMVSPVEFIPLLEESGLIVDVGDWVLRESCRLNKLWQDQGLEPIRVSVNVSSVQFKQEDFIKRVEQALEETGLESKYLEVELTESCLMDDVTKNIDILYEIKKMGIAISIDDFGTGYSSLSYLKKFPIDTLKIDRSFITNVQDRSGGDNAAIVTAIMALSHSLRLDVVAEGVETAQELAYLHALGCKTIQGFLFSKPLSVDEFTKIQQDSMRMKKVLEKVREELAD